MTSERRYFAEPSDVVSLEIKCKYEDCGSRVLASIEAKTPANCPSCGKALFDPAEMDWHLLDNLRVAIAALKSKTPRRVRIELRDVPNKDS